MIVIIMTTAGSWIIFRVSSAPTEAASKVVDMLTNPFSAEDPWSAVHHCHSLVDIKFWPKAALDAANTDLAHHSLRSEDHDCPV